MKNDQEIMNSIRAAIDDCTRGIDNAPSLQYQIARKAKGEEPVVKKISTTIVLVAALLAITAVAFAATNGIGITAFLSRIIGGWNVNENAIVAPVVKENTSKWLNLTGTEAYWAEDGLSVVLKVDSADDEHVVCYSNEDGLLDETGERGEQIAINGEMAPLDQWRGEKELIIAEFSPLGEGWNWYKRTDDGLFVIVTFSTPDAEALQKGTDVAFQIQDTNIQTGETEECSVTLALPAMTMQEGHK